MPIHFQDQTCEALRKAVPDVNWAAIKDARENVDWAYRGRWYGHEVTISLDTADRTWIAVTTAFGEPVYRYGATPDEALTRFVMGFLSRLDYVRENVLKVAGLEG